MTYDRPCTCCGASGTHYPLGGSWATGSVHSECYTCDGGGYLLPDEADGICEGRAWALRGASIDWHNSDGLSPDASASQLSEHLTSDHPLFEVPLVLEADGERDALDQLHYEDHSEHGECGAHEGPDVYRMAAAPGTPSRIVDHGQYMHTADESVEARRHFKNQDGFHGWLIRGIPHNVTLDPVRTKADARDQMRLLHYQSPKDYQDHACPHCNTADDIRQWANTYSSPGGKRTLSSSYPPHDCSEHLRPAARPDGTPRMRCVICGQAEEDIPKTSAKYVYDIGFAHDKDTLMAGDVVADYHRVIVEAASEHEARLIAEQMVASTGREPTDAILVSSPDWHTAMNRNPDGSELSIADLIRIAYEEGLLTPDKMEALQAAYHNENLLRSKLLSITRQTRYERFMRGDLGLDTRDASGSKVRKRKPQNALEPEPWGLAMSDPGDSSQSVIAQSAKSPECSLGQHKQCSGKVTKGGSIRCTCSCHRLDKKSQTEDFSDKAMVAFYVDMALAEALEQEGYQPAEDMHVTLAYLGDVVDLDYDAVYDAVALYTEGAPPVDGAISGLALFTADDGGHVLVALVDSPGLEDWRAGLILLLEEAGVEVDHTHGFTPHITLAYLEDDEDLPIPIDALPKIPLLFNVATLSFGDEDTDFELSGQAVDLEPLE